MVIKIGKFFITFILGTFISIASATTYEAMIARAQNEAINNQPKLALQDFQFALQLAGSNPVKKRIALFGLAKMQLWLGQYPAAKKSYQQLLNQNLNQEDHEIALTGYVNSLVAMDQPIKAYKSIPPNFHYTQAGMVVAAAQAADQAGWPEKAAAILQEHQQLLRNIPVPSNLALQLMWLRNKLQFILRNNHITPAYQFQHDSDNFSIQNYQLSYSRRITPGALTQLTVGHNSYSLDSDSENGTLLSLSQSWWPTDFLYFKANASSVLFDDWKPFLWNVGTTYRPNDFINIILFNCQDIVETIPAIQNQISQNSTELDIKIMPIYRVNLFASIFTHNFSDENQRNGIYANLSFLLSNQLGLSIQGQTRYYRNSIPDSPNYFSPSKFEADSVLLILRRRLFGFGWYYINGGIGRQIIDSESSTPTHQYAIGVNIPIQDKLLIGASYGYSSVASALTGFSYHYGAVNLDYSF